MAEATKSGGVLVLDTCGDVATVALAEARADGTATVLAERMVESRRSSEGLLPELRAALREVGWTARDLRLVGAVRGPGSFTGVRVGLSAAKGLSEGLGVELVAPTRFAVMAAAEAGRDDGWTVAVLRAAREEFFWALGDGGEMGVEGTAALRERIREEGGVVLCQEEDAGEFAGVAVRTVPALRAAMATELVVGRWRRGEVDEALLLDAVYVRRTEQELLERQRRHREERAAL